MLRASPNQVVAGTEGPANWVWPPAGCFSPPCRPVPSCARAGGLAGQPRGVGPPATAPSEAMRSSQSDWAQVCVLAGRGGCSNSSARRPSERAPPCDHLDSILFAWKLWVGGGPVAGRGSSRRGMSETVSLEHRETVLAAPGCRRAAIKASRGFPPSQPHSDWSPRESPVGWRRQPGAAPGLPGRERAGCSQDRPTLSPAWLGSLRALPAAPGIPLL